MSGCEAPCPNTQSAGLLNSCNFEVDTTAPKYVPDIASLPLGMDIHRGETPLQSTSDPSLVHLRGHRPVTVIKPSGSWVTMWSREAEAVSLALGSTARGRNPLQALCTSLRRTSTVRYSAMASRMNRISSSVGCGRAVISELLSVCMPPATQHQWNYWGDAQIPATEARCAGRECLTIPLKARCLVCNDTHLMSLMLLCR